MKSLMAFIKKEWMDLARSGRFTILFIIFVLLGIMNPAIAKLTPWLLEMLSESMEQSGLAVTEVTVDAMTSWTQFYKNIPIGLIAFALISSNIFTKEYSEKTLILVLTKGLNRYKVIVAKALTLFLTWSVCYWSCFGITYGYNAYFWDNSVAHNLIETVVFYWLVGVLVVALIVLFSVLSQNITGVLLGTGGVFAGCYIVGMIPKLSKYLPTKLMNTTEVLSGAQKISEYYGALIVTVLVTVVAFVISVPIFNKKKL